LTAEYLTAIGRVKDIGAEGWRVILGGVARVARNGRYVKPADLRAVRESAGLTQKEAAAICSVDERTYQRWELGERKVRSIYLSWLRQHVDAAQRKGK
jgi:DNA-binding XRE family transcriptional regulator